MQSGENTSFQNISVIGAGAFGTAMALTAYRAGHTVTLVSSDTDQADTINTIHTNPDYFPDYKLPALLTATTDLGILKETDAVIVAIPSHSFENLLTQIQPILPAHVPVLLTIKGLVFSKKEGSIPLFPREIFKRYLSNPLALISGPNFAVELVHNLPAATSLATRDAHFARILAHTSFRVYPTQDYVGVEVAGVVKNVLALGCGMIEGAALGRNALFSFLTRGLYEMMNLGQALGADVSTFLSMCGIGDLALTCSSTKSRNFSLGVRIGQGESATEILASGHGLSEGYHSINPLLALAQQHHVEMPLCQAVHDVMQGISITDAVQHLFARPTPDATYI